MSTTPLLVFIHLEKTGGTTLTRLLTRIYGPGQVLSRYAYADDHREEIAAELAARGDEVRVVTGHFSYGVHTLTQRPVQYITLIRHPVRRLISDYAYARRQPDHPEHKRANSVTLAEWAEAAFPNMQTYRLSGVMDYSADATTMLSRAKENIRGFAAAGITERFDESLLVIRHALDLPMPFYVKSNVRRGSPPTVPHALSEELTMRHSLDVELHRTASRLLDEKIRGYGVAFRREKALFRRVNPIAQRMAALRDQLRGGGDS